MSRYEMDIRAEVRALDRPVVKGKSSLNSYSRGHLDTHHLGIHTKNEDPVSSISSLMGSNMDEGSAETAETAADITPVVLPHLQVAFVAVLSNTQSCNNTSVLSYGIRLCKIILKDSLQTLTARCTPMQTCIDTALGLSENLRSLHLNVSLDFTPYLKTENIKKEPLESFAKIRSIVSDNVRMNELSNLVYPQSKVILNSQ